MNSPHVSVELLSKAKELLKGKEFCNTKFLRRKLDITGIRAGAVYRALGWHQYGSASNTTSYKRDRKWKQ